MAVGVDFGRWDVFILVLARIAAVVMVAPFLGARPIPMQVKVALSLVLALLLAPMQDAPPSTTTSAVGLALLVGREVAVGLLLGFAGVLVYSAIQMAAHLISVQIGFGMSSTMDPLWAENSSFLDSFYNLMAMIIFLGLNGHHAIIAALSRSFELVPLGEYAAAPVVGNRLVLLSAAAFATAVQLAMPIMGAILLADAAIALMIRAIPQMNIFSVGLPLKIVVGLLTLSAMMPAMAMGANGLTRSIALAVAGVLR